MHINASKAHSAHACPQWKLRRPDGPALAYTQGSMLIEQFRVWLLRSGSGRDDLSKESHSRFDEACRACRRFGMSYIGLYRSKGCGECWSWGRLARPRERLQFSAISDAGSC